MKLSTNVLAGVPGLEPRQAEPESAGLPITPYPKKFSPCFLMERAEDTGIIALS
ncbi:MAG: hypothetical protein RLZZ251_529 [Actinomycetota bacterium]